MDGNSIGSNWQEHCRSFFYIASSEERRGIQNIGSFEYIWRVHPVGAKIRHARKYGTWHDKIHNARSTSHRRNASDTDSKHLRQQKTTQASKAQGNLLQNPHTTLVLRAQAPGRLSRKLRGRGNGNERWSAGKKMVMEFVVTCLYRSLLLTFRVREMKSSRDRRLYK